MNALLGQMTLQEKIGQMNQLSPFGGLEEMAGLIREGNVGSLLNLTDPELVNKAQRNCSGRIPPGYSPAYVARRHPRL